MTASSSRSRVLEELHLIQCSLLPDEHLTFLDEPEAWLNALEQFSEGNIEDAAMPSSEAFFSVQLDGEKMWFEITLFGKQVETFPGGSVSVKGDDISRDHQEAWQRIITASLKDLRDSDAEYPIYELLSTHLLPRLREDLETRSENSPQHLSVLPASVPSPSTGHEIYHALFTSHHLISPNKRRSLLQWSSSLSVSGFAKVGYPGVIYAQGEKSNIEEFVDNVKAMQWLALKLRFVESLPAEKQGATGRVI
ncbi:hypothetical protein CPB84DRAFT_1846441 [Gymnopilus junonius]|uniref:Small nuclear ribonucleoprotein Prp3 C-terminal domain-containing protein n=1 Tax=Gymnopilus junonius TaxID=109634 RepID=A0A9P5TN68_GYMJU|nr:hypothetical protein CPB84DRAFT_1846441 [Gymnopilus junonius]